MYWVDRNTFPGLKGKGAEVRHLTSSLLSAFQHFMDAGNKQHRQVKLLLTMAEQMESILDELSWPRLTLNLRDRWDLCELCTSD